VVWLDYLGNLNLLALPNDKDDPFVAWEVPAEALFGYQRLLKTQSGRHVAVFSTRAPGKPPTSEALKLCYPNTFAWVVATTAEGRPSEYGVYKIVDNNFNYHPISPLVSLAETQHKIFADQSSIISKCVQIANVELMAWLRKHPEDLLRVHPGTFELIVAELFRDQGYDVEVLGSWNEADGGIDVIAIRKDTLVGDFRVGIQCKRYVKTRTVRADLIWALNARLDKFHLHKGVIATTARLEKSVLADLDTHLWRIDLRDFGRLKNDLESWGQFEQGCTGLWLPKVT
jgi:hypothetical protein